MKTSISESLLTVDCVESFWSWQSWCEAPCSPRRDVPVLAGWLAVAGLLCLAGCTRHAVVIDPASDAAMRRGIVSRAGETFDRAVFYKPRTGAWPGTEETFAPLIVWEVGKD